eukprot:s699_g17.t1
MCQWRTAAQPHLAIEQRHMNARINKLQQCLTPERKMPRGGHMGIWRPLPKDIFKSRWKRFFKRCYRPRTGGNALDRAPPHIQADHMDGVPSPWKLHMQEDFGEGKSFRDSRIPRGAGSDYRSNLDQYLRPAKFCTEGIASDVILRSLDPGRHNYMSLTGLGKLETAWQNIDGNKDKGTVAATDWEYSVPTHILSVLKPLLGTKEPGEVITTRPNLFVARKLRQLCEEKEIRASGEGPDRGNFPYVDEQASLLDELTLNEILRIRHKTNSRRHPKWKEVQYWFKRWHGIYLRKRAIKRAELKEAQGIAKKALGAA